MNIFNGRISFLVTNNIREKHVRTSYRLMDSFVYGKKTAKTFGTTVDVVICTVNRDDKVSRLK